MLLTLAARLQALLLPWRQRRLTRVADDDAARAELYSLCISGW